MLAAFQLMPSCCTRTSHGFGCIVLRVHGAGASCSVHYSGCAPWRAAMLMCTHPRCRSLPVFEEDHAWRTSSFVG